MNINFAGRFAPQIKSNIVPFKAKKDMDAINKTVAVYCASSTRPDSENEYARKDYHQAEKLGKLLAQEGYGVLTGGSVGSMEALNKGCKEAGGRSVGVTLELLKEEQKANEYCDELYREDHFYPRLERYREQSAFQTAEPGGVGTLMEVMDQLCMVLTNRTGHKHQGQVVLRDKEFWQGFVDWLKDQPVKRGYIKPERLNVLKIVDTPEEVVAEIKKGADYDPMGISKKWGDKFYTMA